MSAFAGESWRNDVDAATVRRDKVSSLLGEYLLKGWCMLESICPKCSTVLMKSRQGKTMCVNCELIEGAGSDATPNAAAAAAPVNASTVAPEGATGATGATRNPPPMPLNLTREEAELLMGGGTSGVQIAAPAASATAPRANHYGVTIMSPMQETSSPSPKGSATRVPSSGYTARQKLLQSPGIRNAPLLARMGMGLMNAGPEVSPEDAAILEALSEMSGMDLASSDGEDEAAPQPFVLTRQPQAQHQQRRQEDMFQHAQPQQPQQPQQQPFAAANIATLLASVMGQQQQQQQQQQQPQKPADPQQQAAMMQVHYSAQLAVQTLNMKLQQAAQLLSHTNSIQETIELCQIIAACGTAIQSLQPLL